MFSYPVVLEPDDNGTVLITFPDVPGAVSFGDDDGEALAHGVDALETALIGLMEDKAEIPVPSKPRPKQRTVTLPALSAAKVGLYQCMRAQGVKKVELGRRTGLHPVQVDRLLDLRHSSKIEQVQAALHVLGKELSVEIRDAA